MGRYPPLWLLGVPIPILVLIFAFGGLTDIVARMSEAKSGAGCSGVPGYAALTRATKSQQKKAALRAAFSVSFR